MIHWTIYPTEYVASQFTPETSLHIEEVMIQGISVQILVQENGEAQIFRVLSSDPQDYLRAELQPGTAVTLGVN
ncbi:YlzJ-like family protein [Risungbinella massiliensis]|uniref:YlzJ-like family protein n=1 Tax=Risungbinella massiliensis TaxID=1329796 RepID=UPI0005CC6EF7|nr:YlzJ-like family protein [Risungbinella massiliensis]